eukprot:3902216-Amphidinium_carterae.1
MYVSSFQRESAYGSASGTKAEATCTASVDGNSRRELDSPHIPVCSAAGRHSSLELANCEPLPRCIIMYEANKDERNR